MASKAEAATERTKRRMIINTKSVFVLSLMLSTLQNLYVARI